MIHTPLQIYDDLTFKRGGFRKSLRVGIELNNKL